MWCSTNSVHRDSAPIATVFDSLLIRRYFSQHYGLCVDHINILMTQTIKHHTIIIDSSYSYLCLKIGQRRCYTLWPTQTSHDTAHYDTKTMMTTTMMTTTIRTMQELGIYITGRSISQSLLRAYIRPCWPARSLQYPLTMPSCLVHPSRVQLT